MTDKDLLKAFKRAAWDEEELDVFSYLAADAKPSARAVAQMLDVLCNKRYASDATAHQKRCAVFAAVVGENKDKQLFLPCIRALKDGDTALRRVLVAQMPEFSNLEDHPKLCDLLRSQDREVRAAASAVLKKVGGRTVLRLLNEMVLEHNFPGRSEAIDIALPVAGHHAVPTLEAIVSAGTPDEKNKALKCLGDPRFMQKTIPEALRAISGAFDDRSEKVVCQAIASFCNHCSEEEYFEHVELFLESPRPQFVVEAVSGLKRFSSIPIITVLERKLRSGPNAVRAEVLNVIEAIGTEDVLPPLVEAVGHKALVVRQRASEVLTSLSQAGKIDIARIVLWLLRSRDANVRRVATELLQTVEDPSGELWPKLLSLLRDEDWWVRERVLDALVQMAGRELTPHLVNFMSDENDVVRRCAIDALIRLKDPKSLRALGKTARQDEDWWAKEKAIEAIAAIGDRRAIPFLIELLKTDEEVRLSCIQALRLLNAKESAKELVRLLTADDKDVRHEVLLTLDHFNATQYAGEVQCLLADPDNRVARQAKQMLVHWKIELSEDGAIDGNRALSLLDRMLVGVAKAGGDDLILAPGSTPYMKRMDRVVPLSQTVLTSEQLVSILTPVLSLRQHEQLRNLEDVDHSYEVRSHELRFRANIFQQRGGLSAVFRIIKGEVPKLDSLGVPDIVKTFSQLSYGLVLVGGPTGSGKSTTLSAIIDDINCNQGRHIISLENPIEVVHKSQKGLVNQREAGLHTQSFQMALRSTLRQDPDVILVGEIRDLDTIRFAVTAADTGHLVFGTVHTVSADTTVDRLLNAFPPKEQDQIRASLAGNLRAVLCQNLLKRKDGTGRVLACEIMVNSEAVANLIRKGQTYQIPSLIVTSHEQGMQLMDKELMRLFKEGLISAELAYMKANEKSYFADLVNEDDTVDAVVEKYDSPTGAAKPDPKSPALGSRVEPLGTPKGTPYGST